MFVLQTECSCCGLSAWAGWCRNLGEAADLYQTICKQAKALTVSQPWALLLVLNLKTFEGRARSISNLAALDRVWICSSVEVMGFSELSSVLERVCRGADLARLKKFLRVESITEQNYKTLFPGGKVLGRVQFGEKIPRAAYEHSQLVPAEHAIVYPVVRAQVLPEFSHWDVRGCTGATFQLAAHELLAKLLQ